VNFIFPLFLIAGVLLAVPVIIHLFNFRKFQKVLFPDIRFLQEIKEQTNKHSKLKRRLILLSRLLAAAALILAFAQPYFSKNGQKVNQQSKAVSIYIDNSFSLAQQDKGVPRLEVAKNQARDIIESFGETDKFQVLSNNFSNSENQFYTKKEALIELSRIEVSPKKRKTGAILEKQKKLLQTQSNSKPLIAFISDFQKSGFDVNTKNNDTIPKYFIPISQPSVQNISIDTVDLVSGSLRLQEKNELEVKLTNYSNTEQDVPLTLSVNGQIKAVVNTSLPKNASSTETVSFTPSRAGSQEIKLYIADQPISFDDTFYVAAKVVSNYSVLILNQNNANAFLSNVFKPTGLFKSENNNVRSFNPKLLPNYSLVVLNAVNTMSASLSESLVNYCREGGNILVFAPQGNPAGINRFLQTTAGTSFGALQKEKLFVSSFNKSHPVFSGLFEKIPDNVDLPVAFEHYSIRSGGMSGVQKLFTFSNGDGFLNSYRVGNGKLYVCASNASKQASTFPNSYWFLPLMYKMAMSQQKNSIQSVVMGAKAQVAIPGNKQMAKDAVFHITNGTNDIIPAQRAVGNQTVLFLDKNVEQGGLYQSYLPGAKDSLALGINYSRDESDMSFWKLDDLKKKSKIKNASWLSPNQQAGAEVNSLEKGTPLWKVCIIFALLFLLIEILLIRFLK